MSSMFKKKGGLAFKPKIPSARSRPAPAVSTPAPVPKPIHDPVPVESVSQQQVTQEIDRTPEETETSVSSRVPSQTPDARPAQQQQPPSNEPTPADTVPSEPSPATPAQQLRESEPPRDVAIDPNLANQSTPQEPTTTNTEGHLPSISSRTPVDVSQVEGLVETVESEPQVNGQLVQTGNSTPAPASDSNADTPAPPTAKPAPRPRAKRQASAPTTTAGDATDSAKPRKRPRKTAQEGDETAQVRARQRRSTSDNPPRKRRARSLTPEDAENQVVDLQKLKMSDLTKDLHIGKKFSRHDELRERERKARMKTKLDKDGEQTGTDSPGGGDDADGSTGGAKEKSATPTASVAPSVAPAAPAAGPQFRIVDGQIIVDQSSLVMDRHARAAAAQAGEDMETIEENDFTRLITSSSFMNTSKLKGPNIWTDEETELFYRGLRMFGTDFEIISKMFPHKQRRHVKLKYNREERHNPRRIDAAVMGVKDVKMDIDEYKTVTGSEFEPVESIEAEQRKIAEDYEAERKRVADEQEEMMRKKREELFADEDDAGGGRKKKGKRKGKQAVAYGLNGEPIVTEA